MWHWFFKPKKRVLVGRIPAKYELYSAIASFFYMLYEEADGTRVCEFLGESNTHLMERWWDNAGYDAKKKFKNNASDYWMQHHRIWSNTIVPWLDGCDLSPKYRIDKEGCSEFITEGIKQDLDAFFLALKVEHGIDFTKDDHSMGSELYKRIQKATLC